MRETIATAPAMALTPQAIDNLVEELREYHTIYSPLFQRREQREGAAKYLHGLLLEMPRKSIEPMVLALEGANAQAVRTLQLFISEGAWDDEALLRRHWQEVDTSWGGRWRPDRGRQRFSETGAGIGRREAAVLRGSREAGELSSRSILGLCQPQGLHPVGSPPVLAPGVGGGRGVCQTAAPLWGACGASLQNQADVGRGDDPGGAPRPHLAGALGGL